MSLLTLAPSEVSIQKVVTVVRQLVKYLQALIIDLTTQVSGILPIANGGTGAATTTANKVFSGPASGGAAPPSFRALVQADLPFDPAPITTSLGADVLLNNTANYFDGPSVAQGATGTWFVSGTVTLRSPNLDQIFCKLWDGTTVIASGAIDEDTASKFQSVALSGFITSPAGNLRISCRDANSTAGFMAFNASGNSKDCTITAFRIK